MAVMRGTTPTIQYRFKTVDVSTIAVIYLSLKQGSVYIEKDKTESVVDTENHRVSWTLTQEETLSLNPYNDVEIQVRYRLNDGKAGGSRIKNVPAEKILKDGEI